MRSPTPKQIDFVEDIVGLLGIDFPRSSKEFNKKTYAAFISKYCNEFKERSRELIGDDDEMLWFQPLNG